VRILVITDFDYNRHIYIYIFEDRGYLILSRQYYIIKNTEIPDSR